MKIVIDGRMILPYMTGIGRYLLGLIPAMYDASQDLELELWLHNNLPSDHPAWNLAADRLHLRKLPIPHMSMSGQILIPKELIRVRPDLFHFPHFDLPWLVPGSVVSTIHDLKYIAHPDFFPHQARLRRLVINLATAYTCRRSHRVIVVSRNTAQDLTHYLGISTSKIHIVPNGIDRRFFETLPPSVVNQVRRRYSLDRPYLLFVGERRPHKNLIGLIEVFTLFRRMVPAPYQLVIVGKRYSDYQIPEQVTREKDLGDKVRFIDSLEDADLPAVYQAADAFVLLSFYEGFGLPVLEAMASGIPVVASNCTSLPEVAGEAAMLVSPDDPEQAALALRQVIPGGEMRESCITSGTEQALSFTWDQCARLTMEAYKEALAP